MASFSGLWKVIKKIGGVAATVEHDVVAVEHFAAPILAMAFPGPVGAAINIADRYIAKADDFIGTLHNSMVIHELNNPSDGQGGVKFDAVNNDINAYYQSLQAGLAFVGKTLTDDPALRKEAINAGVAFYNAANKWRATIKPVDLPPDSVA